MCCALSPSHSVHFSPPQLPLLQPSAYKYVHVLSQASPLQHGHLQTSRPCVSGCTPILRLGSELPAWPNIQLFLWCISACHFCQLLSVFDSLPAAIFSWGRNSEPCTSIQGRHCSLQPRQDCMSSPLLYHKSLCWVTVVLTVTHNLPQATAFLPQLLLSEKHSC